MLSASFMMWPLAVAVAYVLALIAAWACLAERGKRLSVLALLSLPPAALFVTCAYDLWRIHVAESVFERLCQDVRAPVIAEPARRVASVNVRRPDNSYEKLAESHHFDIAFPAEHARAFLLGGAEHYDAIETTQWGRTEVVQRGKSRPLGGSQPTTGITWSIRDVQAHSRYISAAMFVLKNERSDRRIVEVQSYVLDTPDVVLLGVGDIAWRMAFARKRACPNARQLAETIKSAARPF